MIDERIAGRIREAAGPSEPDPEFAAGLYAELAGLLSHAPTARSRPLLVLHPARRSNRIRLVLVAAVVGALLLALLLAVAGAPRPVISDVRLDGVDAARTGIHPGPGPERLPIEAWSLPVGPVNFTPVVADGVLFFGGRDRRLRAVDAVTGTQRWEFAASDEIEDAAVVGGGRVAFIDLSAALFSVDVVTGRRVWRGAGDLYQEASPAMVGGTLFAGGSDGRVHALAADTGREIWSIDARGPVTAVTALDEVVYAGTIDGRLLAIAGATRNPVWPEVGVGNGSIDRIAADGRFLFAAVTNPSEPGRIVAIERATGRIGWTFAPTVGTHLRLGALRDGLLYVTSTAGVVALASETGTFRWHAEKPASTRGLVLSGPTLYVAADPPALVALDVENGATRWEVPLAGEDLGGLPVVTGGFVFIGDGTGMHAFADRSLVQQPRSPSSRPTASIGFSNPFGAFEALPLPPDAVNQPAGTDVGPDGRLYVVDAGNSRIVVLGSDGRIDDSWGDRGRGDSQFNFRRNEADPNSDMGGIAVAGDGTVYVADTANDRIQVFTPSGGFLFSWGTSGSGSGQFLEPFDLDVCSDGRVMVVDDVRDDIQVFDARGGHLGTVGSQGSAPGQLLGTGSVQCLADGGIINADWQNNRVQGWDPNGRSDWTLNDAFGDEPPLRLPSDIAVDEAGNLWVVDRTRVLVFDRDRRLVAVWRPREHGLGRDPMSIVLDGQGRAYVGFPFDDRIVRLRIDQSVITPSP